MAKRTKNNEPDNRLHIEEYYKRWNFELDINDRWNDFKNRVLNSYMEIFKNMKFDYRNEFKLYMGIYIKPDIISNIDFFSDNDPVYNYFASSTDVKKFVLGIEVIFKLKTITITKKEKFLNEIKDIIVITGVPLEIKNVEQDIFFYPFGAKLLDEKLINDNLNWLSQYPKTYEAYKNALLNYDKNGEERNVVDNLRLALELLLKEVLKNRKSLENQKNEIGNYFKLNNVNVEIANMFNTILSYYTNYQNDKAKHNNSVSSKEVEYILYLTGTFIRFVLTVNNSSNI